MKVHSAHVHSAQRQRKSGTEEAKKERGKRGNKNQIKTLTTNERHKIGENMKHEEHKME